MRNFTLAASIFRLGTCTVGDAKRLESLNPETELRRLPRDRHATP
jgi:hypothetical protein